MQIVLALGSVITSPAFNEAFMQAAFSGSTPITLILGFNIFASVLTPVASPPPRLVQEYNQLLEVP